MKRIYPIVLLFTVAACGVDNDGPAPTPAEVVRPGAASAQPAALPKVDNGDGTWSFALRPSFDASKRKVAAAMTWRYVGQVKYDKNPRPVTGPLTYIHRAKKDLSTVEQLKQTQMEDAEGRLWAPIVDATKVVDATTPDSDLSRPGGGHDDWSLDGEVPEPKPGQLMTWTPASWTKRDCDNDGDDDWFIWDADSRRVKSSPSAPRQRTVVRITNTAGQCSGTIIRDRWVLTAAHCTYTNSGAAAGSYSVRNWNGESVGVALVFRPGAYNYGSNGWDPNDDYVMLKLSAAYPSATGDMDISSISNSNINTVNPKFHNLGFPGWLNSCGTSNSQFVHTSNNDITGKNSRSIRWKGDVSGGHSGGPVYYCPGSPSISACDSDDTGFVVGVVAGFSGYYNRNMGPRGSYFKSWAVNIMDNN